MYMYMLSRYGKNGFYRFISSRKINPLFTSGSSPNQATCISKQGQILLSIITLQRKMIGTKCRDFTGQQSSMSMNSYCTLILHIRHIYALLYQHSLQTKIRLSYRKIH